MCKWPLKSINRRQIYLIRWQTIVPDIDYTITKMEFASINIRMTFTNTKVVTPSGTIILYIKHSTVININKSVNYFKQKYQCCAPARHLIFPTPPTVSPKFPHVPLGWPFCYEERRCWANCPCTYCSFQDFQRMWSWSTNVTDGQTDGRHAISIPRFSLNFRAVKSHCVSFTNLAFFSVNPPTVPLASNKPLFESARQPLDWLTVAILPKENDQDIRLLS